MFELNNLHITLTEFCNATRVLKQTRSIVYKGIASNVFIAALHSADLEKADSIARNIFLKRFSLVTRTLPKKLIFQILKYLEFSWRIGFYYRNKDIGMLNIHTLSLLPLGVLLKCWYGAKLIYDTHELETEVEGSKGIRKWLAKKVERFLIGYCDQVFVVGEAIADWYADEYRIPRPVVILNAPRYQTPSRTNRLRTVLNIPVEKTIYLYQGGLFSGRGVDLILTAFKELQGSDAVIVFMGYGQWEREIQAASRTYGNIYFHPAVSPDVVLEYTSSADVGMHLIKNTCLNHYYCMPNKLFEYTMAGIPVIVSNVQEMANFVEKHHIGIVVDSISVKSIISAVEKIKNMNFDELRANVFETSKSFCWEEQENKMITAYRKLLGEKKQYDSHS